MHHLTSLAPAWRRALLSLVALPAALVIATAPASAQSIAWKPCKDAPKGLQCARVAVPLNWVQPDGRMISLAVIRHPASKPTQRIGSLFVNFGGPGASTLGNVKRNAPRLDRLGAGRFDVVGWDPRGVGESTHISCFASDRQQSRFWGPFAVPATTAQSERMVRKTTAFAKRCQARNRDLLQYDSTADTARDMDYLRQLVGDPQLNYRGISYGTFIGQTYANLFPDRVRAMVLDANINPLTYTDSVQAAMRTGNPDMVIRKFLELCKQAGPKRCALARGGDPARRFARLVARLQHGTIPAPKADPPVLTYSDLIVKMFLGQVAPAGWPDLARALDHAARGDGSAIAREIQAAGPVLQDSLNSATALQCADKPVPPQLGPGAWPEVIPQLTRAARFNGPLLGWILWAPCSAWTIPAVNRYTGPWNAVTPNRILVIGTRYDPRTPYRSSVIAAQTLGNAVLLTHDGYGHTSDEDPSACIQHHTAAYLTTLATPPPGTVCKSDHQPFSPNFGPSLG